jgi:hypothetical protein
MADDQKNTPPAQTTPPEQTDTTTKSSEESVAKETFYAWAPIDYGAEFEQDSTVPGGRTMVGRKTVEVGEEVDAGKLGLRDSQFQELVDSGAVKVLPFPDQLKSGTASPREIMFDLHKLREGHLAAGYFGADVIEQLQQHAAAQQEFLEQQRMVGARVNPESPSGTPEVGTQNPVR